jgi:ADP-ribose pyrophosphatase
MPISADSYSVVETQVMLDHPWVKLLVETLEHHGRRLKYFYLASPVEAVAVVALTGDGRILLTRQYRHPVQRVIYDLPAGRLEPGEAPLAGAARELEEETGYRAGRIEKLGYYNQFPGTLRAATNLFFATDLVKTRQNLDEGEELEVVPMSFAEALAMVLRGDFIDGSLQMGVLLTAQKGLAA